MKDFVVGMGEALWDVLPEGKKIGGAPANFAYHVSQFGLPSCVVSAVGNDALGKEIIENFTSKGLNHLIEEVPYPTGTVQVEIDQAGIPQYEIKENVAWDNILIPQNSNNLPKTPKQYVSAHSRSVTLYHATQLTASSTPCRITMTLSLSSTSISVRDSTTKKYSATR